MQLEIKKQGCLLTQFYSQKSEWELYVSLVSQICAIGLVQIIYCWWSLYFSHICYRWLTRHHQ